MSGSRRPIVVLGMMSKHPVPGVVWQTLQYLVGLERLGFEAYYVEAGAHQPSAMLLPRGASDRGDRSEAAAAFLDGVMRRFGLGGRWAFQALHADGRAYGLSDAALARLWDRAELVINLHGGTRPRDEHAARGRLVYLETDPVQLQIELHRRRPSVLAFLAPHAAFFSFAENYGSLRCGLPAAPGLTFLPTRQPVVCDFWDRAGAAGTAFTTIGNWEQRSRPVRFRGEVYHWSKHLEFLKFLEVPRRTAQPFELALSPTSLGRDGARLLASHGWTVRDALAIAGDLDAYRGYIQRSRAEFTVAKDQNVRFRTGWFSDRSASYLAAGRPVVTQETGFSDVLPTGAGLFAYSSADEVVAAVESIAGDYARHARAAEAIAREYFDYRVVLGALLDHAGAARPPRPLVPAPGRPDPTGEAIDRLNDAIVEARRRVSRLRAVYEAARAAGDASAPVRHAELTRARARVQQLRDALAELEDRQDGVGGAASGVAAPGGSAA